MNKQVKSTLLSVYSKGHEPQNLGDKIFHCNFFPKNRKGADKVLSVYWFVVLFIVAGGVVYMVAVFYGAPYDVREVEANLLINQIADCVATGGSLNGNLDKLVDELTLLQICKINFKVEDEFSWKEDQFYVNISSGDFDKTSGMISGLTEKVVLGNSELKSFCELGGKTMPKCVERSFYVSEGKVIKIFVGVKKVDKNA